MVDGMRPMMRNSDWKRSNERPGGRGNLKLNLPPKKVIQSLINYQFQFNNKFRLLTCIGRPVPSYDPIWFKKEKDPFTGNTVHVFNGKYWDCKRKQDWSVCPDIF